MMVDTDAYTDTVVTVCNCVKAKDGGTPYDVWHLCTIKPAMWHDKPTKSVDGDGTVHISRTQTAQIPLSRCSYLTYDGFVQAIKNGILAADMITMSLGDYIVHGMIAGDNLSREQMLNALKGKEYFTVKAYNDCTGAGIVSTYGLLKYASMIEADGS